jgi:23S rRNA pseudouridine1911/1915/1917 synthase
LLSLDALLEHESEVQPEDIPLDLVHADPDLLVLNKPAGLVVHPAAGNPAGTLQNALLHFDPGLAALPRAGIVHRLDKDTSGIMVVARSLRAHSSLVDQLQRRRMGRIYRAVAAGDLISGGRIEAAIGRHPRDRKRMAVVPSGKHAVSHFRVLKRFGIASYIEVSLETGRTHQIRVHMAHIGHPLVGDSVYGRPPRSARGVDRALLAGLREFPRQALHATTLALEHPGSGEAVEFTAPMPSDMRGLLALLDQVGR